MPRLQESYSGLNIGLGTTSFSTRTVLGIFHRIINFIDYTAVYRSDRADRAESDFAPHALPREFQLAKFAPFRICGILVRIA